MAGPRGRGLDCWYSIGLRIGADGVIADVLWNGPADKARLAPGEKVIAVNGQIFSADTLRTAIRASKGASEPIHFIVQADNFVSNADIDYHDGERYPVLERIDGAPAYLDDITKPLTVPEHAPAAPKKDEDYSGSPVGV
jgi:predicted metalloprotease with PDZ domain